MAGLFSYTGKTIVFEVFCLRGQVSFEFIIVIVFILLIFVGGLAIFSLRQEENISYSQKWALGNSANMIARNIESVWLLDGNAVISDVIVLDLKGISFSVSDSAVAFYNENFFVDSPFSVGGLSFLVSDFNGLIFFKKVNGDVVVDYS